MTPEKRKQEIADAYLLGVTQADIAERFDITQPRVSQIIAELREEWRRSASRSTEELVAETHARLLRILTATEDGLLVGDPRSVEAATKLVERISKLLGLEHADRMSQRMVELEEAKMRMMVAAAVALLDHLGLTGDQREEAINVMEREWSRRELV